ncbi:HAMP domain-containing sensor histidine kinase [Rufibacter hautae]|uniref:histidine kinase n=1 Tax=Rufibacter hautae TaxID=2595005 RepID=A0A5B6TFV5_9BACT|nr:HAMP domain-containing sensor histidine kinase [Rufibacter hautae]KAA3439502.1 HAMP domain-containing histidine kinase [Rufibacter hautae]
MNIQTRATLLFSILTSLVVLLFSGFMYGIIDHYAFEDFYKRLETRVNIAADLHLQTNTSVTDRQKIRQLRQEYLEKLKDEKTYLVEMPAGNSLAKVNLGGLPPEFVEEVLDNQSARFRKDHTFYAGQLQQARGKTYLVAVSAYEPYWLQEVTKLSNVLVAGFLILVVIVYLIGRRFTWHTFKPVRDIIKNVQGITAENLNLRLPLSDNKDELTELAETFNDMLTRLETAFETQNNFVSNASHELRTPLTIIKGEAELTLASPGLSQEQRQSVEVILQEAQVLRDILTSLLGMAQSGFDGKKQNWELLRMDELLWLVKASADQLYPGNNIRLDYDQLPEDERLLQVQGNENLLKLALSNIMMNACKYSHNQEVAVRLQPERDTITVVVQDKGIGIPEEELPYVFVPFFRASNTTDFEGHGVGLPLALNIIRLHRGSIGISTREGAGTEMRILLPVAPASVFS